MTVNCGALQGMTDASCTGPALERKVRQSLHRHIRVGVDEMGRLLAAPSGVAFFLIAFCSSALARTCEDCGSSNVARLDVTSAVDTATSFVIATVRKLRPAYDVQIVEGESFDESLSVAEYAAAYDARDGQLSTELPGFRHRYEWQLTYRDDVAANIAQSSRSARRAGTDVTLDDSWVFGLRFELDYGWKR
jgi:hypothetical protein